MDRLEERMDRLEEKVDRLEERMDRLEVKVDRLEERMDRLEVKVDRLEEKVDCIDQKHDRNYIELRNQRQIDSNNIAKILNLQTQMMNKLDNRMYA